MKHMDDGALRRLLDEPDATASRHLDSCPDCQARYDAIAAGAAQTATMLATGSTLVDAEAALRRLHRRLATEVPPKPRFLQGLLPGGIRLPRQAGRPLAIVALVAAAATTLVVTGAAAQMVSIFEPQQVAAIAINPNSLGSLPDLSAYGTIATTAQPSAKRALDWSDAGNQTGLQFLQPGALPSSVQGTAAYYYLTQGKASFTFDKNVAAATAAARGVTLPALPSNLDGATLYVQAGPGAVEVVGKITEPTATEAATPQSLLAGIPQLVIVQAKAPSVTSSGPSVKDFEDALLSMPGISADLAAQVRALGDPSSTLPIPIPTNLASSQSTNVNGASAVLIGDNTGIGSAVVWVSHGMVYAVAGTLTQNDIMAVARSLH